MSRPSQRRSRLETPPRDPAPIPVSAAAQASGQDDNPGAQPPAPRVSVADNPDFLHDATPRKATTSALDTHHKQKGYFTHKGNQEMDGLFVHADLDPFFDDYVPQPAKPLHPNQRTKIKDFSGVPYSATEVEMYAPLCETFRRLFEVIKSPCVVNDTSGRIDKANEVQDMMPDLCLYDGIHGREKYELKDDERMSSTVKDKRRVEHLGRTAWAWMTSFIEVKSSSEWAPFNFDDTGTFEVKDTDLGKRSRAQIIKYVSEIQHRQHRTFVLCAFICGDWVRFMRWDRTGAIVSAADNYVKDPRRLLDFIHRIATASPEGQGYDPTVTLVEGSDSDIDRRLSNFRQHLTKLHEIDFFDEAFGDEVDRGNYPLYELTCEDVPYRAENREAAGEATPPARRTHSYWISKIHAGARSPTGRGTKAFIAIDIDHKQVVFLKDYWCPDVEGIHPELDTYARLRQSKVRFVATALAGGAVAGSDGQRQTTVTQDLLVANPRDGSDRVVVPPMAFHYRFVVREVGQPLDTYENSSWLWRVITSSIKGHRDAYEKAKVLHRDISARNILINPVNNLALIIDWDLAKYMDTDFGLKSHQSGRSGTWPFMSAKLLRLPKKPNELADDLESFIHVLCVMVLCYHKHDLSPKNLAGDDWEFSRDANARNARLSRYLHNMFYANDVSGRYHLGGDSKLTQIKAGAPGFQPTDQNLQMWISDLYKLLQQHYAAFPVEALEKKWGIVMASTSHVDDGPRAILDDDDIGFDLTEKHQATSEQAKSQSEAGSSSVVPPASPGGTPFQGLNTYTRILRICEDLRTAAWRTDCDKTYCQSEGLPKFDGTPGNDVASSLGASGSSAGKRSRASVEGDSEDVDVPANKKSRKKGRGRSKKNSSDVAVRRSSRNHGAS